MPEPGVIDLGALKDRSMERDKAAAAIAERKKQEAITRRFQEWDKQMTRTFKGIFPTPERHSFLRRSLRAR